MFEDFVEQGLAERSKSQRIGRFGICFFGTLIEHYDHFTSKAFPLVQKTNIFDVKLKQKWKDGLT
jgi:hypothetical protein